MQLVLSGLGVPDDIMQIPEGGQGRRQDIYQAHSALVEAMIGGDSLWPGMGMTGRLEAITPYPRYARQLARGSGLAAGPKVTMTSTLPASCRRRARPSQPGRVVRDFRPELVVTSEHVFVQLAEHLSLV